VDVGTVAPGSMRVGSVLREARLARGLTLKMVGSLSAGRFSPTAVAGYERGERNISLVRFLELASLYGVSPIGLLATISQSEAGTSVVDLTDRASEADVQPDR
jgi:transcriptional regulator with XRE-family HTH domain